MYIKIYIKQGIQETRETVSDAKVSLLEQTISWDGCW